MKMKRKFESEIASCDCSCGTSISRQNKPASSLIRSKYANIMIKVDEDVYHLDRLQLACKSDYFEKLFIEDFREKKIDFLELPVMDSDTFSTIVDLIYKQDLKSSLNADNYVQLLMAMDYLQMKIDLNVYGEFIKKFIQEKPSLDLNIIKLCKYVAENKNFDDLMPSVYTCMSAHFAEVQENEEFLNLPLDQVIGFMCGERINFAKVTDVRQCSRVCVKWIFHDVENRLPHAMKLVNAVKRRLSFPYYIANEDFKVKMRDAGEEVTPDSVLRCFVEMVVYQGEIGADNVETPEMRKPREPYEYNKPSPIDPNERDKMIRFLENGDLHDIVVQVEGNTYKLHRCKLLSESGYFENIFSTESSETSALTNKDEEYLLDVEGVDQKSFDTSIRYIYFRELELNSESVVSVLKTACLLKIDSLISDCESWIMRNHCKISSEIVFDILNFIRNVDLIVRFEKMYKCLLCRNILSKWSSKDDCSLFCAISVDMLEDWLMASVLHEEKRDRYSVPANLGLDDSDKLLDLCSKWVMENVQNRYHFIPRIARAINCNLKMNCNGYKMETPDMSNCSEQLVRNQLLKVLQSFPIIAQDTLLKNTPRKSADEPVFVQSNETMIRICNAEMDEIVTLRLYKDFKEVVDWHDDYPFRCSGSSTTIGDNLFTIAYIKVSGSYGNYETRMFFQAYNMSSKKFTSLAYFPLDIGEDGSYVLLNCRSDIYCCYATGLILKYVIHLNRWSRFVKFDDYEDPNPICPQSTRRCRNFRFASDGKILYRMYETEIRVRSEFSSYTFTKTNKLFETYDFDQNIWTPIPYMTIDADQISESANDIIITKNGDVVVLFSDTFVILNRNSRTWRLFPTPARSNSSIHKTIITQWEDVLLLQLNGTLYYKQFSDLNQDWKVKKCRGYGIADDEYFDFGCLSSFQCVHRPAN